MRLIDIYAGLKALALPVFTTNDISGYLNISKANASTILARLERAGHLIRIKRGSWVLSGSINPFTLAEHLTFPFPAYISLQSALYFHRMISQIPDRVFVVSPARTRSYHTKMGVYSIHHVAPSFFIGFDSDRSSGSKIAVPEKALLDFFYLSPAKSDLFKSLPEIELPASFNVKKARRMIKQAGDSRRIAMLEKKFNKFVSFHFPLNG